MTPAPAASQPPTPPASARRRRLVTALLAGSTAVLAGAPSAGAARAANPALPLFDAHLHYSHDAWDDLPPERAVALLREAGLRGALVSSSGDDGTQRLVALAPELVSPALRPYRRRGEIATWIRDDSVVGYVEDRLNRHHYVALGEYHVYGADADLPVPRALVALARRHGLVLHAHGDAEAIERQLAQWPQARLLWAHAGFEGAARVGEVLARHPAVHCDLAFRTDHAAEGRVDPDWRALFLAYPERFLVGTDTFTPERWHYVVAHARSAREWLATLPPAVADAIAWRNGERLFAAGRRGSTAR